MFILFVAMPPAPAYPQQMMTQMCNDWQAPMYNVSANGHMPPFMSGMAYAHPGYNLGAEIQDMNYGRENGRRNGRGRGIRRDNYSRTLNPANEMQSGYMGDQAQYHPQIPIMYIYPDHSVSTQQHQVATGQIYYTSPMYTSIPHPHPNAQSISSNSHAHPTYPQPNHQAPQINRCMQQSQSVPSQQSNQEPTKQQSVVKSHDKHVQNASDKSVHQVNENNSLQSNVVSTVIVNNSTSESSVKNVDENTANKNSMTSSEKVDPKLQHNIRTINENCNGTEKVDVPYVNITNDKTTQNNETDKKLKTEVIPNTTVNTVKTSPKSISVKTDKNEGQIEENIALKDTQDKTIIKTPNGSSTMPNDSLTTPNIPSSSISETSTTTIVRSYASLLRKDSTSETHSSCKPIVQAPVVYQNEMNRNESNEPKTPVQKESTSPIRTPENQNDSSDAPALQNGILQNCYDDPNTYRIGGKYKKQSNLLE